jgi:hypothetical protein
VLASKTAIANRGYTMGKANSPGTASLEEAPGILMSQDTIANRQSWNRIQEVPSEVFESPETLLQSVSCQSETKEISYVSRSPSHELEVFAHRDDSPRPSYESEAFDQARFAAEIDVRNESIGAAVAAEVVDEAEIKDEQRRRQRIRYTCLASTATYDGFSLCGPNSNSKQRLL